MRRMAISTSVDFQQDGRQTGHLRLPHSTHRSAYGHIRIPIACLRNGDGPSLLVVAGNHGDEYEGHIAARRLVQSLDLGRLRGRIIVLPSANHPALMAGQRTSPLDDGNLNRCFPGDPDGTPTRQIADYIEHELMPQSTHAIDLHSGGSSLDYVPSGVGNMQPGDTPRNRAVIAMLDAFGAPTSFVSATTSGAPQSFASAAIRQGVVAIGTEAGGAGRTSRVALDLVEAGLKRLLAHLGMLRDTPSPTNSATRLLQVGGADYFVFAGTRGIFEPLVEPSATVTAGQPAARIHDPLTGWTEPETVCFERDGFVLCRRSLGHAEPGDCLYHLGTDLARPSDAP